MRRRLKNSLRRDILNDDSDDDDDEVEVDIRNNKDDDVQFSCHARTGTRTCARTPVIATRKTMVMIMIQMMLIINIMMRMMAIAKYI